MNRCSICDICLIEGVTTLSKWKTKWKSNGLKVDLCDKHKDAVKSTKATEVLDLLLKAEQKYNQLIIQ